MRGRRWRRPFLTDGGARPGPRNLAEGVWVTTGSSPHKDANVRMMTVAAAMGLVLAVFGAAAAWDEPDQLSDLPRSKLPPGLPRNLPTAFPTALPTDSPPEVPTAFPGLPTFGNAVG